jgi:putative transposase
MLQPPEKRERAPALQKQPHPQPSRDLETSSATKLRNWPHSPAHHLREAGSYIVTAGTYKKVPVFKPPDRLTILTNYILGLADRYGFSLQAWAVFPNHYHLVGNSQLPESLRSLLRHLHSITAIEANKWDGTPGRRVWFEFWETRITFPRS